MKENYRSVTMECGVKLVFIIIILHQKMHWWRAGQYLDLQEVRYHIINLL